jgi:GntP family gluconate:H+ symporter
MAAIGLLKADVGRTILYAILIGLPTAAIAGPVLAKWIMTESPEPGLVGIAEPPKADCDASIVVSFPMALTTLLLPIGLMLLTTIASVWMDKKSLVWNTLDFLGNPVVAMTLAVLFAFWSFGFRCGHNGQNLLKFTESSLAPTASILLVVGAGGGFNKVLLASGVAESLASVVRTFHFNPLFLSWMLAGLVRVATGSATVGITTAAGILAPTILADPSINRELAVLAMGAGSLILSHLNDGGFWFVKEYMGLTVGQTLRSWTVLETSISILALGFILILSRFLS